MREGGAPLGVPPGSPPNDGGRAALLLGGCYGEAMTANVVAGCVDNLRSFLTEPLHPHMIALSDEIRKCGTVLLQLLEQTRTHPNRVPVLLDYLDLLLPCFQRSVLDIRTHYEDKTKSKEVRWRTMYHKMTDEAGGMQLPQRFTLYHQFLLLMSQMLTRSPNFDMNALEVLQKRILQLREKQGIEPPAPAGPLVASMMTAPAFQDKGIHWAEDIFSRPLPSRTPLKHLKFSECYGPWVNVNIPPNVKILFRRSFDQERLSIFAFVDPETRSPFLVIRSLDAGSNNPAFSIRGVHELCVERDGSCLVLKRWSYADRCSKMWAVLYFMTWEELVLFHCTFVSMKFEGLLTKHVHPIEHKISREKRLFQASIIDDGFKHSLLVYQDVKTRGLRLHAAVWDGVFRRCPVWTAFITHQSQSATWLARKNKHSVWLNDVQLYVFCSSYRQEHMRQNKSGAFELEFVAEEAAQRFKELFYPPSSTTAGSNPTESTTSSDAGERTDASK